jgi:hypothetical protein
MVIDQVEHRFAGDYTDLQAVNLAGFTEQVAEIESH